MATDGRFHHLRIDDHAQTNAKNVKLIKTYYNVDMINEHWFLPKSKHSFEMIWTNNFYPTHDQIKNLIVMCNSFGGGGKLK